MQKARPSVAVPVVVVADSGNARSASVKLRRACAQYPGGHCNQDSHPRVNTPGNSPGNREDVCLHESADNHTTRLANQPVRNDTTTYRKLMLPADPARIKLEELFHPHAGHPAPIAVRAFHRRLVLAPYII